MWAREVDKLQDELDHMEGTCFGLLLGLLVFRVWS